jgi:hypothetical protein
MSKLIQYNFTFSNQHQRVYCILGTLCSAAMNRLMKSAENSLVASSVMFSYGNSNMNGDLSSNTANRGGGLLMVKSKEEYGTALYWSESENLTPKQNDADRVESNDTEFSDQAQIVRYSHIKTALVFSLSDLDNQTLNLEFRNVFRLSHRETILSTQENCQYFSPNAKTFHTGNLYLSQNFVNFASLGNNQSSAVSTSMLFESSADPTLIFVIPYNHIVAVNKHSPTALTFSTKLTFAISGYLSITTKNKVEFWLSFGSTRVRDATHDDILSRIKSVDWEFDGDVVIGGRNGPSLDRTVSNSALGTENKRSSLLGNVSLQHSASNSGLSVASAEDSEIHTCGLKFIYPAKGHDPNSEHNGATEMDLKRWTEYFENKGKDVCMIKDIPTLRQLIITTAGLPDMYRGDFWMLVTGAWYSKPPSKYYTNLLKQNEGKKNPFAEEIEKDVRRFLMFYC